MRFTVYSPATISNIGAGFDVLAVSLKIYNIFHITTNHQKSNKQSSSFHANYKFSQTIEKICNAAQTNNLMPKNNMFQNTYNILFQKYNVPITPIRVTGHFSIPPSRGMGSSASAIIAALVTAKRILKHYYKIHISQKEIFDIAYQIEGHPDNIAACLYGGLVIPIFIEKTNSYDVHKIPFQAPIRLSGVIPNYSIETKKSRFLVPKIISLKNTIFHTARMASLSYLLSKKRWTKKEEDIFQVCMQDKLHQSYRERLNLHMQKTFEYWKQKKSIGSFLSGSGSTLMGFWNKKINTKKMNLGKIHQKNNIEHKTINNMRVSSKGCFITSI